MNTQSHEWELPEEAHIGRVTLRVRSVPPASDFYTDVVGLTRQSVDGGIRLHTGDSSTQLLALDGTGSARPRPPDEAGLYHLALRVPDRDELGTTVRRIEQADHRLDGASDHLVSEALYLSDPESNGVEVYADRPREEWEETTDGSIKIATLPLDLDALATRVDERSVGHVHLETTDLDEAVGFYRDTLGLSLQSRMRGSTFLAAGRYHHHVGLNTWQGRTQHRRDDTTGIVSYELVVPPDAVNTLAARLRERDRPVDSRPSGFETRDPDGIGIRVRDATTAEAYS